MILQTFQNLPITDKKKQLLLFFVGWLGLVLVAVFASFLVTIGALVFLPESMQQTFLASQAYFTYINFLAYAIIFSSMVYFLWPWLNKHLFKSLTSTNWWLGFAFTFVILFSNVVMLTIYDLLGITLEDNQNQTIIVSLVQEMPIISFMTFVFLGPIVEEWTYRLGLFQYLRNKNRWVAYAVTLLVFGFIHFDFSSQNLANELLNLPLYAIAGGWFCYLYDRYGLRVAMTAHIFNNFLSVLAILVPINDLISSSL